MELKDEADEFVPLLRELIVAQVGYRFGFDRNSPGIGCIEQTENIEQRTFATSRGADYGVNASSLDLKRHTAQGVHAFLFFAEVAFDPVATQANFCAHLDPRMVTTGANSAARRAGT
jgi:hypothetical protein